MEWISSGRKRRRTAVHRPHLDDVGPEVSSLQQALSCLERSHAMRAQSDLLHQEALRRIEEAVPRVATMVGDASQTFAAAGPGGSSAERGARNEAVAAAKRATQRVQHELASATRVGDVAKVAAAGGLWPATSELVLAARRVKLDQQQLHAARAALSDKHNAGSCLILRVFAIDTIRAVVMVRLSLRHLWRIRRVCADFQRWAVCETASLPIVPRDEISRSPRARQAMFDQATLRSAYIELVEEQPNSPPSRSTTLSLIDRYLRPDSQAHPFMRKSMVTMGFGGRIYVAGGQAKLRSPETPTLSWARSSSEGPPSNLVSVWLPNAATTSEGRGEDGDRLSGRWRKLQPMETARYDAKGCVVDMSQSREGSNRRQYKMAEEALVVIGGRNKSRLMLNDELDTVELLQPDGNWRTMAALPVKQSVYCSVCALPDQRVAVAGFERHCRSAYILSIADNRWSRLPRLNSGRASTYAPVLGAVGGVLFALGGSRGLSSDAVPGCEILYPNNSDAATHSTTANAATIATAADAAAGGHLAPGNNSANTSGGDAITGYEGQQWIENSGPSKIATEDGGQSVLWEVRGCLVFCAWGLRTESVSLYDPDSSRWYTRELQVA